MKLIIRRNQAAKKGVFGGHKGMKFSLECRVELTDQERAIVDQYKVNDHVLTWRNNSGQEVPGLLISSLVRGTTQEVDDVTTLLSNEEVIKGACANFRALLEVMATFGGEEVIEF